MRKIRFGTWYQINCETPVEWKDDFEKIRGAGFDFAVIWNIANSPNQDLSPIVREKEKTLAAMDVAGKAGLTVYLGAWNPSCMGEIPAKFRATAINGETINRPDIFNAGWIENMWVPYVSLAAKTYGSNEHFGGLYFDDSFSVRPKFSPYFSYSSAVKKRYAEWLEARYAGINNLNVKYRLAKKARSFSGIKLPVRPEDDFAAWEDWMSARQDWCEYFAKATNDAFRKYDKNRAHQLVLSDFNYYLHRSAIHHGVDYKRLMKHFDAFEIYTADDNRKLSAEEIMRTTEYEVRKGLEIAGKKPFQYHTWFTDPFDFQKLRPGVVEKIIRRAIKEGAGTIEIYTFKVHNWTKYYAANDNRPPFKEVSLKYNPDVLKRLKNLIKTV